MFSLYQLLEDNFDDIRQKFKEFIVNRGNSSIIDDKIK